MREVVGGEGGAGMAAKAAAKGNFSFDEPGAPEPMPVVTASDASRNLARASSVDRAMHTVKVAGAALFGYGKGKSEEEGPAWILRASPYDDGTVSIVPANEENRDEEDFKDLLGLRTLNCFQERNIAKLTRSLNRAIAEISTDDEIIEKLAMRGVQASDLGKLTIEMMQTLNLSDALGNAILHAQQHDGVFSMRGQQCWPLLVELGELTPALHRGPHA